MDILSNLALGLDVALTAQNVGYCFIGVLLGTLIGVLPGIGPVATIAMLLPLTYALPPVAALIMLAGIYYGSQYGGSTTAILVNLPGESSSIVTSLDGYQMARQGRAGTALSVAALSSLFAGCATTVIIAIFAPPLANVAFAFGPPEYFALIVLGLTAVVVLASGSVIKAIGMLILGVIFGLVGTDVNSGTARFTFGFPELSDGIEFVAAAMGMFGFAEIIRNLERPEGRESYTQRISRLWPSRSEAATAVLPAVRGTAIGSLLGILPGGGMTLASFSSYMVEKRVAKDPSRFGNGAIEGVAAPEAANNAAAQTAFIPLLTLGIPGNSGMALMLGAMLIHGIQPGPTVMTDQPELFWGLIASMLIGNIMLVVLNLPLIGIWVRLLSVPYGFLFPAIVLFCCIGVYSVNNSLFDVYLAVAFGVLGWITGKLRCEPAPLLLGFVLGPMLEETLIRTMLMARGDPSIFLSRPIALVLLSLAVVLLAAMSLPRIRRTRQAAFHE